MKIVLKQIFYSINKKESTSYTRKKILINNSNYFIWIKLFKIYKNYLFYKKVIHIFNNIKILKNIWIKIEVEKEIERRGDSIGKITFGITREETKKFCIWNYISNFFLKIII